jgi:Family of unknown function (DUF5677)
MLPSPEQIHSASAELVALARSHLPLRVYGGEPWWALFRKQAIVRLADTVESSMQLMRTPHDLDGHILVRSIYEQVVTFAWVAADPDRRVRRWVGEANWEKLKLHNDAVSFGEAILTPEEVEEIKTSLGFPDAPPPSDADCGRRRRNKPDPERVMPGVADRAREADEYSPLRIRGLHPSGHLLGFRGLYLACYRIASRSAHGSSMSLDFYVTFEQPRNRHRVHLADPEQRDMIIWALVAPLFGMALVIAAQSKQWIEEDRVRSLIDLATGPELRA